MRSHRSWARRYGRSALAAVFAALVLPLAACTKPSRVAVAPTFTPEPFPTDAAARIARGRPAHPLVGQSCLSGLSSYRFSGSFSLQATASAAPSPSAASGDSGLLSGSLANLLSNVAFQGAAQAPDRYQAQITFGGGGVQPFDVLRIGAQTYTRFGAGAWQQGDQLQGLGGIGRFDPQSLCSNLLVSVDAGAQTPVRETVNGVPSLRYEVSGPQVSRALRGGGQSARASATPTAPAGGAESQLTVWRAEHGDYPVRFQLSGGAALPLQLSVDVTDINGKDVKIVPPS